MTAQLLALITTVVVAHFLALVSPGPDFLLIVRSAVRSKRSQAMGVALGIASANGIYIALCIVGVGSLLATSLVLMTGLKVAGALFLFYVAFHAFRSKKADYAFVAGETTDAATECATSFLREFATGFVSGISNPKNILFYLSLFSVVLTNDIGLGFKIGLGLWMTSAVFLWDAFIIYALSQRRIKAVFGRLAFWIDKIAGCLLGLVGLKLIESALAGDRA